MAKFQILLALALICVSSVIGHSYVTKPASRSNQAATVTGCRGPNCLGPCDTALSNLKSKYVQSAKRGDSVKIEWPRNNHPGGFVRFAWAPTSQSDSASAFDNGVQQVSCHEVGCHPDNLADPNGGDTGPPDGSSRACGTSLTIPSYLTDGAWTLQWAWFGGEHTLGDYYSCVDYTISGGSSVAAKSPAVFVGGDFTYPNQQKCKFFNTDRLHQCVNEPCNNPLFPIQKEQSGVGYLAYGSGSSPSSPTPAPTTPAPTTPAPTTPKPTTPAPTTPAPTTPAPTTPKPTTPAPTTSVSLTNCGGFTTVVPNTVFTITNVQLWDNVFLVDVTMHVNSDVNNWGVQIIFPDSATSTNVIQGFNAAALKCTATKPTRHSVMVAAFDWAKTIKAGEEMRFEFKATNTNMNANFIKNNVQFRLFKK